MRRIPTLYNSEKQEKLLSLSTRSDKLGNVYYYVEYYENDGTRNYVRFSHFSSVMDFISYYFK